MTIALLLAGVVTLQAVRDRHAPETPAERVLYVTSPAVATRLALSYRALAADLYWMRAIQYYGGLRLERRGGDGYPLLYPLLDLTTSLDPAFSLAYRFGALFLSEPAPGGAGRPDLAVRLLEKGMDANPHRWEYPYDIGFVHYHQGDYQSAAEWFRRASEMPGAAEWLAPLAATTLARGGDITTSRLLWLQIVDSAQEDWMRGVATHRLLQLQAIEEIAQLDAVADLYVRQYGQSPAGWDDLIRTGLVGGVPHDPAGHPYVFDAVAPGVTLSRESPLWPLPGDAPL